MTDDATAVRIGHQVPEFELDVYDPTREDFDKVSLESIKSRGRWTILFFYPADFTFV